MAEEASPLRQSRVTSMVNTVLVWLWLATSSMPYVLQFRSNRLVAR